MRFIDINELPRLMGEDEFNAWLNKANTHLDKLRKLDKKGRSEYLQKHADWTELYKYLSELSFHKCWYTESPENSTEWEIDHFRPKNRSKDEFGQITLPEGYWWLAYDWKNYRLSGGFVNKRRKDKFGNDELVNGKGDFFPLDPSCSPCELDGDLDDEIPLLLDPTCFRDTTLLSFDKDGVPISNYPEGSFEEKKVSISIKFLNLKNTILNRKRKEVWENTEKEILAVSVKLKSSTNQILRNKIYNDSYYKLKELTAKNQSYSAVALSCLSANQTNHPWISSMLPHLN